MKDALKYFFFPVLLLLLFACRKDVPITDSSAKLEFSQDTLIFDTVFTTIGSTTEWLRVYNPHNRAIIISNIYLAGGNSSNFRMNVDGIPTFSEQEIEIKAKDSIFIFVEVTVDPNGANNPLIIKDSIIFETNGNIQDVDLVAWGQDAYFYPNAQICNITLKNDKPHVFYGYGYVDTLCTLTIEAGTQVYFHKNSGLVVLKEASLIINGTKDDPVVLQGDRLEFSYSEIPGQWGHPYLGGIWLSSTSKDNVIDYAIIKNGNIGLQVDSFFNANPTLTLTNTIITNMSGVALLAQGSDVLAENCVFANCGQYVVALVTGGRSYQFTHCTFANYWTYATRQTPLLLLNNYYEDANKNIILRDLQNTYFGNCIIYGNLTEGEEIGLDENTGAAFDYQFDYCLMRNEQDISGSGFNNIVKNALNSPVFNEPAENDYHLVDQSAAIDKGNITVMGTLTIDLDGNNRDADAAPDLGAYEYQ